MPDVPGSLAEALAALQANLPHIGKDAAAVVEGESKAGKRFTYGYKYADLPTITRAIMPRLGALGLSFTACPTVHEDGRFFLDYQLRHTSGSGEVSGSYPLPSSGTPQAVGSAITYARRYCLCAVTGVAPDEDDDDGQAAEDEARALALAPPETRPDGSATEAELERMRHDRGAGEQWRSTGTAENDPFYDSGQPPAERDYDSPATISAPMLKAVHARYGVLGIKGRDLCLTTTRRLLDLQVLGSHSELSRNQGALLLSKLDEQETRA